MGARRSSRKSENDQALPLIKQTLEMLHARISQMEDLVTDISSLLLQDYGSSSLPDDELLDIMDLNLEDEILDEFLQDLNG
jgi:hypothetical protein